LKVLFSKILVSKPTIHPQGEKISFSSFFINEKKWCYNKTKIRGNKMSNLPNCPKCNSEYTYEDGSLFVCPECAYEWSQENESNDDAKVIKDSNGNVLSDGDTVTVIKDLKVKGTSSVIKIGTKVKGIRLVEGDHDIDCKIDGFGAMKLKSEFVKKV
jgi:protein PhnA